MKRLLIVFTLLLSSVAYANPVYFDNAVRYTSPVYGLVHGFQIRWDDTIGGAGAIANVTFNITGPSGYFNITLDGTIGGDLSTLGYAYGNDTNGVWWINITQDLLGPAGNYSYYWIGVNTTGASNTTTTFSYGISKAAVETQVYINGTASDFTTNVGEPYNVTVTLNVSLTAYLGGNLSTGSGSTPLEVIGNANMTPGVYNVTGYFPGNENYTESSLTRYMYVFGWVNSTARTNTSTYVSAGTYVNVECGVFNANTSQPVSGYYVEIYNGTTNLTAGTTNSSGWFSYTFQVLSDSMQNITCAVYTDASKYFNASVNGTAPLISDFATPILTIYSPQAKTYFSSSVTLNYTSSDSGSGVSECYYSLDSGSSVSTQSKGTVTFSGLSNGKHELKVWCKDGVGNTVTKTVTFYVSVGTPSVTRVTNPSPERSMIFIPVLYPGVEKIVKIDASGHPVREISIEVGKKLRSVSIDVKRVQSVPVEKTPAGKVYAFLEMKHKNLKDVKNIEITFAVPSSWITENNIDRVVLLRYETEWVELPTSYITEHDGYVYYSASSPGLSYFAVSGIPKEEEKPPVKEEEPKVEEPQPTGEPETEEEPQGLNPLIYIIPVIAVIAAILVLGGKIGRTK
ncbi:MAG: PGF-pre-PGF domain-containing protein [Candidatus Micrarchaeota archaeon]|nr:PGF-pre-PGF domain-containing protein [Candidatus Micrarchaeota archaeon]